MLLIGSNDSVTLVFSDGKKEVSFYDDGRVEFLGIAPSEVAVKISDDFFVIRKGGEEVLDCFRFIEEEANASDRGAQYATALVLRRLVSKMRERLRK